MPSLCLKLAKEEDETTTSGREFQMGITRTEKKRERISVLDLGKNIFILCPLVEFKGGTENNSSSSGQNPLRIFQVWIRSDLSNLP